MAAAYFVGRDGQGADGLVGYFQRLLIECPEVGLMLLARMFLLDDDWPPDDRILTKAQNNKEVRDLIRANKTDSGSLAARTTEFPIPELMRIALKYPGEFGKLFAAMVPQPRGRHRRSPRNGMTPPSEEEQHNGWLQFLEACALLRGRARRPPAAVESPAGNLRAAKNGDGSSNGREAAATMRLGD